MALVLVSTDLLLLQLPFNSLVKQPRKAQGFWPLNTHGRPAIPLGYHLPTSSAMDITVIWRVNQHMGVSISPCNGQCQVSMKPGVRRFIRVSHMGARVTNTWAIIYYFSQATSQELNKVKYQGYEPLPT